MMAEIKMRFVRFANVNFPLASIHHPYHDPLRRDHSLAGGRTRSARPAWGNLHSELSCSRSEPPDWTRHTGRCYCWWPRLGSSGPGLSCQTSGVACNQLLEDRADLRLGGWTCVGRPRSQDTPLGLNTDWPALHWWGEIKIQHSDTSSCSELSWAR